MIAFEKDVFAEQVHEESMPKFQNVFEAIAHEGHEESFVPVQTDEFEPTDLPAGSWEKGCCCDQVFSRGEFNSRMDEILRTPRKTTVLRF